jgi:hypothetical protein
MSISRPLLLALVGAVLLGATFFAVLNARERAAGEQASVAQSGDPQQLADQAPPPSAQLTPQEALKAAFSTDVQSARFDAKVSLRAQGESGSLELTGAYQGRGRDELPQFEVDVKLEGGGEKFDAGFVSTGDKAWFTKGETGYPLAAETWKAASDAAKKRSTSTPIQLPFDPSNWVKDVKSEGSRRIDGVETEHVSASVDTAAALRDLTRMARTAGGTQAVLPKGALASVERAVKRADFDVFVGSRDRILRRLTADLEIAPPRGESVKVALAFNLSDVNEPQRIAAPAKVRQGLPGGEFGEVTQGFLQGLSLTTGADPSALKIGVPRTNAHRRAARAVARHRKVVILFRNPKGLDDKAVTAAVRSVARNTKALVLRDHVANVDQYGSFVRDVGVSQAPAIVVVDRRGDARLIEGFVDAASLAQVVADAR